MSNDVGAFLILIKINYFTLLPLAKLRLLFVLACFLQLSFLHGH